jgi:hypothetical protein
MEEGEPQGTIVRVAMLVMQEVGAALLATRIVTATYIKRRMVHSIVS